MSGVEAEEKARIDEGDARNRCRRAKHAIYGPRRELKATTQARRGLALNNYGSSSSSSRLEPPVELRAFYDDDALAP